MIAVQSRVILASSSPRRRELLGATGLNFEIIVSDCDETPIEGEKPRSMVERLAVAKAQAVSDRYPDATVIGADTTVFIENEILGKPLDKIEACSMLSKIQNATHVVWGGVAIIHKDRNIKLVSSHSTEVTMCAMSADEIAAYVETGEPMDKAGSYAIQGIGLQFVASIKGSYSNVVGLNIAAVMRDLRAMGVVGG